MSNFKQTGTVQSLGINLNARGHNLPSCLEHRDPKSDLTDIETGRYLQGLQDLPQSVRQLLEDGNLHVVLDEFGVIVKLIRKRDPEFLNGREDYFVIDQLGRRIPVTEEELDAQLGIEHNPDDVYNCSEVTLEGLDAQRYSEGGEDEEEDHAVEITGELVSEYVPPMDRWDVIYDATEYTQTARRIVELAQFVCDEKDLDVQKTCWAYFKACWEAKDNEKKRKLARFLRERVDAILDELNNRFKGGWIIGKGILFRVVVFLNTTGQARADFWEKLGDKLIYSADLFPLRADKRLRTQTAQNLAKRVGSMTKQELGKASATTLDARPAKAKQLHAEAMEMSVGKAKGRKLLTAQSVKQQAISALRRSKAFKFVPENLEDELPTRYSMVGTKAKDVTAENVLPSERKTLWDMWRCAQVKTNEKAETPQWLFAKMFSGKLLKQVQKGEMTRAQATKKLRATISKLFRIDDKQLAKVHLVEQENRDTKAKANPQDLSEMLEAMKVA